MRPEFGQPRRAIQWQAVRLTLRVERVTLRVTHRSAEGSGLHGLRGIRLRMKVSGEHSGAKISSAETARFRACFGCGGMAEWSMAVVLKTGSDRSLHSGYILPLCSSPTSSISGHNSRALTSFRARPDNRSPERSQTSSKFACFSRASHTAETRGHDQPLAPLHSP